MIREYKSQSVFFRFLIILLLYAFVFLLVFIIYGKWTIKTSVRTQLANSSINMLQRAQNDVDDDLLDLYQHCIEISQDEYIKSALTAPDIQNSTRNYDVIYQLEFVAQENRLIDSALLYIPTDDTVLSGLSGVKTADNFLYYNPQYIEILEKCREDTGNPGDFAYFGNEDAYYFTLNTPTFYLRNLGTIICKINMKELCDDVNASPSDTSEENIWVFDDNGQPVFHRYMDYPEFLTEDIVLSLLEGEGTQIGNNVLYLISSPINGWKYIKF